MILIEKILLLLIFINYPNNSYNSSTYSQLKLQCSNNMINKQLTDIFGYITNLINTNQISSPNSNSRETKIHISNTFSSTELNKLNNFLFQYNLYFYANSM